MYTSYYEYVHIVKTNRASPEDHRPSDIRKRNRIRGQRDFLSHSKSLTHSYNVIIELKQNLQWIRRSMPTG